MDPTKTLLMPLPAWKRSIRAVSDPTCIVPPAGHQKWVTECYPGYNSAYFLEFSTDGVLQAFYCAMGQIDPDFDHYFWYQWQGDHLILAPYQPETRWSEAITSASAIHIACRLQEKAILYDADPHMVDIYGRGAWFHSLTMTTDLFDGEQEFFAQIANL